jgi:hypothetical protein
MICRTDLDEVIEGGTLRGPMIGCKSIAHFNRQRSTDEETSREMSDAIDTVRADACRAPG